jgi:type IV pilus assembly protein PilV
MTLRSSLASRPAHRSAGFTVIEILVTMMVVAIGVLGAAGLQAFATKISHHGSLRSQAVILGVDLMERIEANNPAAMAGSYAPATWPTAITKDCISEYCQPSELATFDLVQFTQRLQAQLPSASISVAVSGADPVLYTVQINWRERISKSSGQAVQTTGGSTTVDTAGMTEQFSLTITKMFNNRAAAV